MADKRPKRMCDSCGGVDDHPRHVFAHDPTGGVTQPGVAALALENAESAVDRAVILMQIQDSSTIMKHMDCCRADGCPDGTCYEVTAGAEDLRGPALVKHLTKGK